MKHSRPHIPALMLIMLMAFATQGYSQQKAVPGDVIQLSGIVGAEINGLIEPLPYVNVYVKGTRRGTFTESDGFFSIVGREGEVVVFSSIGFKEVEYTIPDTLVGNRYSIVQLLTKDTVLLPETVIYPWPSREHFKLEFLAMETDNPLQERLDQNLSDRALAQLIQFLPTDGDENVDYFLREQAAANYYAGQFRPMNVLNAFAWAEFIKALKRGDFKKKE